MKTESRTRNTRRMTGAMRINLLLTRVNIVMRNTFQLRNIYIYIYIYVRNTVYVYPDVRNIVKIPGYHSNSISIYV